MARKNREKGRAKNWSLLVYIAGDNNLSDAGLVDIEEMCREGASRSVHVGVQIDTAGEHEGSIRYEVSEPDWTGKSHRIVIERLPESDSGAPATLLSFLMWGLKRYPARRRAVVVWGHGAGFRVRRRDVAPDDFGSSLDMPEITGVLRKAGIGPSNRLSVLGFDACLMSMLEIAHHFRDYVDVVVGSQQTEPGDGWPYDKVLAAVKSAGTPAALGREIVSAYIRDYEGLGQRNVTQSAVDAQKTEAAMKALADLGGLLSARFNRLQPVIRKVRPALQAFDFSDFVDVVHMATLLQRAIRDAEVRRACRALRSAVAACVIANESFGEAVKDAHGVSIWFPFSRDVYFDNRGKYLALDFAKKHRGWISFLDAYFA